MSYATAEDFTLPMKSYVVVQMEKSQELAWVCRDSKHLVACLPDSDLGMRAVHRATAGDLGRLQQNRASEEDTFKIARKKPGN